MLNNISVLFLGDIVGISGRKAVKKYLERHRSEFNLVIANGENATHGKGLSLSHYNELISSGIDVLTNGNHFFNCKDPFLYSEKYVKAIRPYNFDSSCPLKGYIVIDKFSSPIVISNFIGRVFLTLAQSNPFTDLNKIISLYPDAIHIVDFHAEATGEKRALAEYASKDLCALLGTHTHVQTNDAKIISNGALFMSDVGMNGAYDSILGDSKEECIKRTATGLPARFRVEEKGKKMVNGISFVISLATKKVQSFEVINEIFEE